MTSARDEITNYLNASIATGGKGWTTQQHADAILATLNAAGFAIVPKALLKPKVNAKAFARLDEMAEADIAMDGDHALSVLLKHYCELTTAKGE